MMVSDYSTDLYVAMHQQRLKVLLVSNVYGWTMQSLKYLQNQLCQCFKRQKIHSTHWLDLNNVHSVILWETWNIKLTYVLKKSTLFLFLFWDSFNLILGWCKNFSPLFYFLQTMVMFLFLHIVHSYSHSHQLALHFFPYVYYYWMDHGSAE